MNVYTDGANSNYGFIESIEFVDDSGNPIDISAATTKTLVFVNPMGIAVEKTASFTTSGTDGLIQYQVEAGLFVGPIGEWSYYGVVRTASTFLKSTQLGTITVVKVPWLRT